MYMVVLVTCKDKKEAKKIALSLVEKRLAACINIIDKIESIFWWQRKIDQAKETLLLIKSKKKNFSRIVKEIKRLHSYQVPEIIALRINQAEKKYLSWLDATIRL